MSSENTENTEKIDKLPIFALDSRSERHIIYLSLKNDSVSKSEEEIRQMISGKRSVFMLASKDWEFRDPEGIRKFLFDLMDAIANQSRSNLLKMAVNYLVRHIISMRQEDAGFVEIEDGHSLENLINLSSDLVRDYFGFGGDDQESNIIKQLGELSAFYLFFEIYQIWLAENSDIDTSVSISDEKAYQIFEKDVDINEDIAAELVLLGLNNLTLRLLTHNQELIKHIVKLIPVVQPAARSIRTDATKSDLFTSRGVNKLATARVLGLGLEAQYRRPDWKSEQISLFEAPLAYKAKDSRGKFDVMFYIGDDENNNPDGPMAHEKPVALGILQRWGIVHARLYLGIGAMLTKSKGHISEMRESDLMFAAGLQEDIKNSNLSRSEARKIVFSALKDLKKFSLYLMSNNGEMETGRFPIYQIEPLPLYKVNDQNRSIQNIRARVAPGLWAKDIFKFDGGPSFPFPSAILQIPAKRHFLPALFSMWFAYNQFLFENGRSVEIRKILREILPEEHPHQDMDGIEITWRLLEPYSSGPLSDATKNARSKVRKQFAEMPHFLNERGIEISFLDNSLKLNTPWSDFLCTRVVARQAKSETKIEKKISKKTSYINREQKKISDEIYLIDKIRDEMKSKKISQRYLADAVGVSQSLMNQWLTKKKDIPKKSLQEIKRILSIH